jgi:hypothetical protein
MSLNKWMLFANRPLDYLVSNPDAAIDALNTAPITHTPENHHMFLGPMVAYAKYVLKETALQQIWKTKEKENWAPVSKRYDENKPSEHQKDKVMEFKEIMELRESLEKGSIERLLLSFYTLLEPNRADYFATELVTEGEESSEENYIVDHKKVVLRDFKTKTLYDKIENTLSEELQSELEASLKKTPRRYLFVREDGTAYPNRKQFSNWACRTLTRVLHHPMTLTALRHIYIKEEIHKRTPEELTDMARKMGHTRSTQRMYEWIDPAEQSTQQSTPLIP